MSLIEGSTVFYLTQSFRFGPEVRDSRGICPFRVHEWPMAMARGKSILYDNSSRSYFLQIAHLCDSLLTGMKGVADKTVIGNDNTCTTKGEVIGQLCVISRSNSKQFAEAVKAIGKTSHWGRNGSRSPGPRPRIAFAGNDTKDSYFKQVLGRKTNHQPLKHGRAFCLDAKCAMPLPIRVCIVSFSSFERDHG